MAPTDCGHDALDSQHTDTVLEDGAAVFVYECQHAEVHGSATCEARDETFYDMGPACGAESHVRFNADTLTTPTGETVTLTPDADEEHHSVVQQIEQAHRGDDSPVIGCDPDPDVGSLTAELDGYRVHYTPAADPIV